MKTTGLGQWSNAPLAFVIAQIRFEAITELESKYLNEFQDAIREKYPRFSKTKRLRIPIVSGSQDSEFEAETSAWDMLNPARTKNVRVERNSLTYMVTSYTTFKEFSEDFEWIICEFYKVVKKLFVTRLGERYIDFILPSKGNVPEQYVGSPLNERVQIGNGSLSAQFNYYEYKLDVGRIILKYTRAEGLPELPPDLGTIALEPSTIMKQEHQGESATLDTDRILDVEKFMDCEELIDTFRAIHQDLSKAFKSITTEFAKQEWGAK